MNVIDALVVTLGLDASGFKKGQAQSDAALKSLGAGADRTAKDFVRLGAVIGDQISRAQNRLLGFLALFTAGRGMASFARETAESGAALGRLSRDLQINAQRISQWEQVSRRAGNSAGAMQGAFQAIQARQQAAILSGDMGAIGGFRALGVEYQNRDGSARGVEDVYRDILTALRRRGPGERGTAAGLVGLGQESVNLAALAPARMGTMFRDARETAATDEQVAILTRLRDAYLRLDAQLEATGAKILEVLAPALEALIGRIREFASWLTNTAEGRRQLDRLRDAVKDFAEYLTSKAFMDDLKAFRKVVMDVVEALVTFLRWLGVIDRPPPPDSARPANVSPEQWRDMSPAQRHRVVESAAEAQTPEGQQREARRQGGLIQRARDRNGADQVGRAQRLGDELERAGLTRDEAAYFVGNGLTESQLSGINERNPIIPGSRGGFGYFQWTGPRRDEFERFAARNQLDPASEEANRRFAAEEVTNTPHGRRALAEMRAARTDEERYQAAFRFFSGGDVRAIERRADRQANIERAGRYLSAPRASSEGAGSNPPAPPPDPNLNLAPGRGASLRWGSGPQVANNTSTNETAINGPITIHTAATDAPGIARDLGNELRRLAFVGQAVTGLT